METKQREHWGSRLGVILAVMGSAVGLGNFLRFPGLAAKYEGGAFMIPYFCAFLLLGMPLAWVEWAVGRHGGTRGFNSAAGIYRAVWPSRAAPYFGAVAVLVPVVIYMYYVVLEALCLRYAIDIATGTLPTGAGRPEAGAYEQHMLSAAGMTADGTNFSAGSLTLWLVLLCFVLNFVLIYRGLTKGIEWFCTLAMPALLLCALVVLARVLTLSTPDPARPELNVWTGLGFMWNPRAEGRSLIASLADAQMWMEAAGQIFFSLSVGFGIIVNYASYVRPDDDIALSALTSASGNQFAEVGLAGMTIVPAAFMFFGLAGAEVAGSSSFALGFLTLPMVFASMLLGQFVGTLFFALLFLAALTSSLSMLQPAIALLEEGLGLNRRASVALLGFVTLIGSAFVLYFSAGLTALDTFDFWIGTFCIYVLAVFQTLVFGWVFGVERGRAELARGAAIRVPRAILFVIRYVSPVYLLAVFAGFVWQQLTVEKGNRLAALRTDPTVQLSVAFIVAVGVLFVLLVGQSVRRWRRLEAAEAQVSI